MSIRSAIVTIDDPVDPLISEPSGALAEADRWHRGIEAVVLSGSDVTGIRQVGVYKGSTPVAVRTAGSAQSGGCGQLNVGLAYTFTKPCEGARGVNGAQSLDVNTVGLGDGTSTLRLVVRDTAGNEAARELVVKVDNIAPAPRSLEADSTWSAAADAGWTWTGSAEEDRAPVTKVEVERCLGAQGCAVDVLPGTSFGGAQSYSHPVPEGESTLRVRETDAAGNVGSWSEPSTVRRDRTAPGVHLSVPDRVVAGEPVAPEVTVTDALSGPAETHVEVRADSGAWRAWTGSETASAGTVLRFRARARDHAQNVSEWHESDDVRVEAAPQASPTPNAQPTPRPEPTAVKLRTRIRVGTARIAGRRLTVTGRLVPKTAAGVVQLRVGGRCLERRLRDGAFGFSAKVPRQATRRATLLYRGDAAHDPARRRVRLRRTAP